MRSPNRPKVLRWHQSIAILLCFFTFVMSASISQTVFERIPHLEDELAYLYQARIFAGGQLTVASPQPANAYWQPFVLDSDTTGQRFGKYTPGFPAILAIGVWMGQAWLINAVFAMLTVALVYRLGCALYHPDVGVIAALLTAFSPAALLLNGSLMSHTVGLFFATGFVYAYYRMQYHHHPHRWGIIAGVSLGALAAARPLTTVVIGLPFVIWSVIRLLASFRLERNRVGWQSLGSTLTPLLLLAGCTLVLMSSIPLFNYVTTGDASQNLYELVWEYDRIGFGEGHGRNRHRLEKALNHARFDLSLTASDLFGWQFDPLNEQMVHHLLHESGTYPGTGYSFALLPLGIIIGLLSRNRRYWGWRIALIVLWASFAYFWVWFPQNLETPLGSGIVATHFNVSPEISADEAFSWLWIIVALGWLYVPLIGLILWRRTPSIPYTGLLVMIVGGIVIVQMLYWIGSQRYSTRYYYEALTAASLLTALPLGGIIRLLRHRLRSLRRVAVIQGVSYALLVGLVLFTFFNYSLPRVQALYRFNGLSPELAQSVRALRIDNRPILVIVNGTTSGDDRVRWRAYGSLMAITSPYLDSEIVVVRDYGTSRQHFIAQYPDRQVIDLYAVGDEAYLQPPSP